MKMLKNLQANDEVVNLPHDFLIGQDWVAPDASERPDNSDAGSNVRSRLSPRGFKEMGIGWYRQGSTYTYNYRNSPRLLQPDQLELNQYPDCDSADAWPR